MVGADCPGDAVGRGRMALIGLGRMGRLDDEGVVLGVMGIGGGMGGSVGVWVCIIAGSGIVGVCTTGSRIGSGSSMGMRGLREESP